MAQHRDVVHDVVDQIVADWTSTSPDVDVSPMEIIGRVSRLSRIIDQRLAENFAAHGIESWMYDVMATLRRIGAPYTLSAGQLVRQTMVTTGAMTNRIDRLEQRGYVERVPSTVDRRSVDVRLTRSGVGLVDEVARTHYDLERRIVSVLPADRRSSLQCMLRDLLVSLGDVAPTDSPSSEENHPGDAGYS